MSLFFEGKVIYFFSAVLNWLTTMVDFKHLRGRRGPVGLTVMALMLISDIFCIYFIILYQLEVMPVVEGKYLLN